MLVTKNPPSQSCFRQHLHDSGLFPCSVQDATTQHGRPSHSFSDFVQVVLSDHHQTPHKLVYFRGVELCSLRSPRLLAVLETFHTFVSQAETQAGGHEDLIRYINEKPHKSQKVTRVLVDRSNHWISRPMHNGSAYSVVVRILKEFSGGDWHLCIRADTGRQNPAVHRSCLVTSLLRSDSALPVQLSSKKLSESLKIQVSDGFGVK